MVYQTQSGLPDHATVHHGSWYSARGDIFILTPESMCQRIREGQPHWRRYIDPADADRAIEMGPKDGASFEGSSEGPALSMCPRMCSPAPVLVTTSALVLFVGLRITCMGVAVDCATVPPVATLRDQPSRLFARNLPRVWQAGRLPEAGIGWIMVV